MGEKLARKNTRPPSVTLRLQFRESPEGKNILVKLNGRRLSGGLQSGKRLEYILRPAQVKKGANQIGVAQKAKGGVTPMLTDLLLWARYGSTRT